MIIKSNNESNVYFTIVKDESEYTYRDELQGYEIKYPKTFGANVWRVGSIYKTYCYTTKRNDNYYVIIFLFDLLPDA